VKSSNRKKSYTTEMTHSNMSRNSNTVAVSPTRTNKKNTAQRHTNHLQTAKYISSSGVVWTKVPKWLLQYNVK